MLYNCLFCSLTTEASARIALFKEECHVTIDGNIVRPSGTCILKVIIRESYVDTNATTRFIREQLSNLDSLMSTKNSDVSAFNIQVRSLLTSLNARGETTTDLLTHLFKGYKMASDKTFVDWIKRREERYDEGEDTTYSHLMQLADNKYRMMVESGEWNRPSKQDEQIQALLSEVAQKTQNQPKKPGPKKEPSVNKDPKKDKGKGGKKKDNDKNYAWKKVPPKEGEPHTKKMRQKTYHWCPNHKAWTVHSPSECNGIAPSTNESKELKLTQALAAFQESESEE
jgi:hypothetical protein